MEKTASDQPQETQFWCYICSIGCASALNLQSHFMGFRHRQVEETLKNHGAEKPVLRRKKRQFSDNPEPALAGKTLDDLLRACKETEPALGLECVYEYHQDDKNYVYECRLCNLQTGVAPMFMHVVGAKHRIAYLSKHHSDLGIPSNFQLKSAAKIKRLRDTCITVEKTFGRKNVVKGSFEPRTFIDDPLPLPALNYGSDKLEEIDFTTDDFVDIDVKDEIDVKPSDSELVTFRELKAKHEEKLKEAQVSVESEYQDQDDQEQQDNEKNNKENGSDMEVCSMDLSERDPDEFLCNQELFDFLDAYKINKKEDVTFILKVTEKFSEVLVYHKKQLEEARQKALAEEEKRKSEELKLKAVEVQLKVEEKKCRAEEAKQTLERQRVVGEKRTAEEARRGAEALTRRVEEAKRRIKQTQQKNGMRQLNQNFKMKRVRKRNRGNKKPFNAQQKALPFQAKGPSLNQKNTFSLASPSQLNPGNKKTFNAQQKTWPFPAKGPTLNQKSTLSSTASSKFNPGNKKTFNAQQRTWPVLAKGPTLNQKSTFPSKLNAGQGPNYSTSVFPITRFDKPQHVGEVGSSFKQSSSIKPQGAESNLVQYPIFPRPIYESQSSTPMSQSQWSSQMATAKRDGAFQRRAPFPHEMQQDTPPVNSSRAFFPPELNMPKDEATNAFFASIKNMEVSEVTSTLNAIATKNPAFRGIHVPSLVKYLNDTGKLKTPHSFRSLSK
ncbi:stress response protein NST1 [Xenopus laevis]|uniref:Stress response protein NST1 n=1 Tax=Xenopus laevis TaxID=8355 RepID=A0A8J0VJF9_XENLA|nr:stress response protein NST1 [Xenopus laevis]